MRLTVDPDAAAGDAVPIIAEGGEVGSLWSRRIDWCCRDHRLDLQILAAEELPLPEPEPSEPAEGAVGRIVQALAGSGAISILRNPAAAFGRDRISFADGLRLFAIGNEADEACWDAMLSLGQPVYGVRGILACDALRPHPASVLSALAYGLFTCEQGLRLALHEDRVGVAYECDRDDAVGTVIIRDGFEALRLTGRSGAYRDRGTEGYVRLVVRSGEDACSTQPRFIAPSVATR
ncbi:MAG: hypothetical protein H0W83_03225 [Planctomycetes bacterium]|nr:hypothetical protein [Planctomycetota bacterium]